MGKKKRREREEKREGFAAKRSREKRKSMLMVIGVLAIVGSIVGFSVYTFVTSEGNAPGTPPGAGPFGGEHEHSSILVRIFGDKFDFTSPAFQIKSSWIHFEGQDGTTVHRHASGVTLGYMFDTLGIGLPEDCFVFPDGRSFCTNEDYSLKLYVNHEQVSSISDYVIVEGDRILISYGSETSEQIDNQLSDLDSQPILG